MPKRPSTIMYKQKIIISLTNGEKVTLNDTSKQECDELVVSVSRGHGFACQAKNDDGVFTVHVFAPGKVIDMVILFEEQK